jgi:hypothetical protein
VSGEATIKATIGAHGIWRAIIPRITAVVPHEHKGVATADIEARGGDAEKAKAGMMGFEIAVRLFNAGLPELSIFPWPPGTRDGADLGDFIAGTHLA